MNDSKYLDFVPAPPKPKTKVWQIWSKSGSYLGEVKYHAPWRQYCYLIDEVVFSRSCLQDLVNFMEEHKDDRVGDP
jgi:hypothetical protein